MISAGSEELIICSRLKQENPLHGSVIDCAALITTRYRSVTVNCFRKWILNGVDGTGTRTDRDCRNAIRGARGVCGCFFPSSQQAVLSGACHLRTIKADRSVPQFLCAHARVWMCVFS
ncbi:hypothetical protein CHARACLAT_026593 [Characodon lateralis]|uniref:Uncharacterized protein n=1 Tax=Characodon lateralis TaxID=208331 RepID=A0ABU7EN29_9TELE|nr:hypothetical protein [Characodon lateralis]